MKKLSPKAKQRQLRLQKKRTRKNLKRRSRSTTG